jgi:hypothetical protein
MASTERSATSPGRSATPDDPSSELGRAAADLEALTDAYDECQWSLESLEAAVEALLDDAATCALVLDDRHRVLAVSRGMSSLLGTGVSVMGTAVAEHLPPGWPDLRSALGALTHDDGWRSLPAGDGATLRVRRATDDDSVAVYVVRYLPVDG